MLAAAVWLFFACSPGCFLSVVRLLFRLLSGCFPIAFRLLSDCLLFAFQFPSGCVPAAFQLLPACSLIAVVCLLTCVCFAVVRRVPASFLADLFRFVHACCPLAFRLLPGCFLLLSACFAAQCHSLLKQPMLRMPGTPGNLIVGARVMLHTLASARDATAGHPPGGFAAASVACL